MTFNFIFAVSRWCGHLCLPCSWALVCAQTMYSLRLQEFLVQEVGTLNNELPDTCQMIWWLKLIPSSVCNDVIHVSSLWELKLRIMIFRSVAYLAQCHLNRTFWTNNALYLKNTCSLGKKLQSEVCTRKGKSGGCTLIKLLDFSHKFCIVYCANWEKSAVT